MTYILTAEEFIQQLYEGKVNEARLSRATGNLVAKMLGQTTYMGKQVFDNINDNVATLESLINDYNKEHKTDIRNKTGLELKIDKAKLHLDFLIKTTQLNNASFTTDIIIGNLLNYRVLIRPIRNAKIITLAYKYYLAMIRHTLQNALISLELASDLFFSQVSSTLTGSRKKNKDAVEKIEKEMFDSFTSLLSDESVRYTGQNIESMLGSKKFKQLKDIYQTIAKQRKDELNMDRYSYGYNQNVFQDSGRNIENLLKANQDKEIQSLAEQFSTIAQASKEEAKNMLANYAASVKAAAESRASVICAKINMNVFDILKMFSIRNIDGYQAAFENMLDHDEIESEKDKMIKELKEKNLELQKEKDVKVEQMELNEKEKEKILNYWEDKGLKQLCKDDNEFEEVVGLNDENKVKSFLKKNYFSEHQISNILAGRNYKISDYRELTAYDVKIYNKSNPEQPIQAPNKEATVGAIKPEDNDVVAGWVLKNSTLDNKITQAIKENSK